MPLSPRAGTVRGAPTARPRRAPQSLRTLIGRFDGGVFDAPGGTARLRLFVDEDGAWDVWFDGEGAALGPAREDRTPDAALRADRATWDHIADDLRGGMAAYRAGRLTIRHNLHLGVGLLAATSGNTEPGRLCFRRVGTPAGELSLLEAGTGPPAILIHGLGATKVSFLPTVVALADRFRVIALDLPGCGDSVKPLRAPYHAPYFAGVVVDLMDALDLPRAHVIGNSLGGRVALELGLRHGERVGRLVVLAPSLAWLRERRFAGVVRLLRPELGLIRVTPRRVVEGVMRRMIPGADSNWVQAGVDEFLRVYLTRRGCMAFYAAARQIYLEEPHGPRGFWTRLPRLEPEALFIWGTQDRLVPIGFAAHVRRALPAAHHLELDCGHVPQLERSAETHATIADFLSELPVAVVDPPR